MTQDGTIVSHSSQHATAYALAFGVYKNQEMSDKLAMAIEQDEEVKMSVYGTYFLLQGLYRSNHGDLARKIMSNPEEIKGVRSWAYMLYGLGATVTTEAWNSVTKPNMSLCHSWGSAPGAMLIQGMIGVRPTSAGFDTFQTKLQPGGVKEASATIPTLKGEIAVSYKMDGSGGIFCEIMVPANTEGTLYVPNKNDAENMIVDGNNVKGKQIDGFLVYELKPGSHSIFANTGIYSDTSEWKKTDIVYTSCIKGNWQEEVTNSIDIGSIGLEGMEAVRLSIRNQQVDGSVQYATYMQSYGWQEWVENGNISGLPESGKHIEAVKIRLTGELKKQYNVFYRAYVDGYGWLDWAENGEPAGTLGKSKAISILQIKLVKKEESLTLSYN